MTRRLVMVMLLRLLLILALLLLLLCNCAWHSRVQRVLRPNPSVELVTPRRGQRTAEPPRERVHKDALHFNGEVLDRCAEIAREEHSGQHLEHGKHALHKGRAATVDARVSAHRIQRRARPR